MAAAGGSGAKKMYLIDPRHVVQQQQPGAQQAAPLPSEQRMLQERLSNFDRQMGEVLNDAALGDEEKLRRYLEILRKQILSTRYLDRLLGSSRSSNVDHRAAATDGGDEERGLEEGDEDEEPASSSSLPTFSHVHRREAQLKADEPMFSLNNIIAELPDSRKEMARGLLRDLNRGKFADGKRVEWNEQTGEISVEGGGGSIPQTNIITLLQKKFNTTGAAKRTEPAGWSSFQSLLLAAPTAPATAAKKRAGSDLQLGSGGGRKIKWLRY